MSLATRTGLITATAAVTLLIGTAPAHSQQQGSTPNRCIVVNGGDYNACNVGNSGAGDRPYQATRPTTPNQCIRLNGGDYNACNVGNDSRGDLPYRLLGR